MFRSVYTTNFRGLMKCFMPLLSSIPWMYVRYECTSTELNLVTAQSTAHEPPEDVRICRLKHVRASFLSVLIINVNSYF
jgi:hypothetical protein